MGYKKNEGPPAFGGRAFLLLERIDRFAVANVFRSVMHCPVGPTSQVQRYALIAEVHAKLKRKTVR